MSHVLRLFFITILHHIVSSYTVSQSRLTQAQHTTYCNNHCGSDLASFHSDQDLNEAASLLNNTPSLSAAGKISPFHGLSDVIEGNYIWSDNTPFDYGNTFSNPPWNTGQPNNYAGNDDCGMLYGFANWHWHDIACSEPCRGLCKHCSGKLQKYILITAGLGWPEAELFCSQQLGTSLASLHSRNDMEETNLLCGIYSSDTCWIGLADRSNEGTFTWTDGTTFDYGSDFMDPWDVNEPNGGSAENCVEIIDTKNGWNDVTCHIWNPYLCNLPSEICFDQNWKVMLMTGDLRWGTCMMDSSYDSIIILQNKQWLYSNMIWIMEYIFTVHNVYNDYGETGITIYPFDSLCNYWHIGMSVAIDNSAYLLIKRYWNDNTYLISNLSYLFPYTDGTYYVLKAELSYLTTDVLLSVYINDIIYVSNMTMNIYINDTNHSKYVGIENININITVKSLFISQTPNYVFTESQFTETWQSLQCHKTDYPTIYPTSMPTDIPTYDPTFIPTYEPTFIPTEIPVFMPTFLPTEIPSFFPSNNPTMTSITTYPMVNPSFNPATTPTKIPSVTPTIYPTRVPTIDPTFTGTNNMDNDDKSYMNTFLENTRVLTMGIVVAVLLMICICVFVILLISRKKKGKGPRILKAQSHSTITMEHLRDASPKIELNSWRSNTDAIVYADNNVMEGNLDNTQDISNYSNNIIVMKTGIYDHDEVDAITNDIIHADDDKDIDMVSGVNEIASNESSINIDDIALETKGLSNIADDEFVVNDDEHNTTGQ